MFVSVIVPVHNAEDHLERTLSAIKRSDHRGYELIVVDDNSQDNSAQISRKFTDQVLELKERRAPGFARNQGAQMSKGDILFFIDADVEIDDHALSRVVQEFSQHPEVAAVFGSYDDEPLCKNFFSQYKNLFHHFVHQKAKEEAKTFWAGCGAVRSRDFFNAGGFAENFPTSSIEDVVLGYRMAQQGLMIRLLKDLRAKHLKKWTFLSLLKTDIFQRAIPWTRLASQKGLPEDLNFRIEDRVSAVLVWAIFVSLFFIWTWPRLVFLTLFLVGILCWLNRDLYVFFLRKRGIGFTVLAVLYHGFYLLYSSFIFVIFSVFAKMTVRPGDVYWSAIIDREKKRSRDALWRTHMRVLYEDLSKRWMTSSTQSVGLKTDLYDEAVSDHSPFVPLSAQCGSLVGMDISYEVAATARAKISGQTKDQAPKITVSDVRHLAFGSGSFDFIFSNSTLDHFKKKEDLRAGLKELARVLRPHGTLIVTLDNPNNPVIFLRNLLPYAFLRSIGLIPFYMGKTMFRQELADTLASCGLEVSQSAYIGHAPRLLVIWLGRFLAVNKNVGLKGFFEKALTKSERLSQWPSRSLTGYYVAMKAIKK